eukprot:UN00292
MPSLAVSLVVIAVSLIVRSAATCCDCVPISCITRKKQSLAWITARGDAFLDPNVLSTHFIADVMIDGKRIFKYRIQWFSGKWSRWFNPGVDDNKWNAKGDHDDLWNQAHKDAGRRSWTMFADHSHEVCYLEESDFVECEDNTPPKCGPCVSDCTGVATGNYASCKSCHVFATCDHGRLIDNRPCATPDLVWDDKNGGCRWASSCPTDPCKP